MSESDKEAHIVAIRKALRSLGSKEPNIASFEKKLRAADAVMVALAYDAVFELMRALCEDGTTKE